MFLVENYGTNRLLRGQYSLKPWSAIVTAVMIALAILS